MCADKIEPAQPPAVSIHVKMADSCAICMSSYTAVTRKKVTCQYCDANACKGCQQQFILSTHEDPHCFTCKRGWSSDFMVANFPLSFRKDTLRKHRRKVLFEREKSILPAMQVYVEAHKNVVRLQEQYNEISDIYDRKHEVVKEYRKKINQNYFQYQTVNIKDMKKQTLTEEEKAQLAEYKRKDEALKAEELQYYNDIFNPTRRIRNDIWHEQNRWRRVYDNGEDAGEPGQERVKREFIMRCPAADCRGFLSTAYKCGVCEGHTCSECLEVLGCESEGNNLTQLKAAHTCNPQSVESAKAIKKETRPCPKCGSRIFKIDGCDQMWCTVDGCGTAFSWNTGQIASGRVHNPHYYEWLRRNGGGQAPREVGDIPCGGIPEIWAFSRILLGNHHIYTAEKNAILDVHRSALDLEARLPAYPARQANLANKDLNVRYLINAISEEEWQRFLEHAEAKFIRRREIGQILQTVVTATADILQGIVAQLQIGGEEAAVAIRTHILPNLEQLRLYTNESYRKLAKDLNMAVPQLNEKWGWIPIRALYRKSKTDDTESVPASLVEGSVDDEPEPEASLNQIV